MRRERLLSKSTASTELFRATVAVVATVIYLRRVRYHRRLSGATMPAPLISQPNDTRRRLRDVLREITVVDEFLKNRRKHPPNNYPQSDDSLLEYRHELMELRNQIAEGYQHKDKQAYRLQATEEPHQLPWHALDQLVPRSN